MSNALLNAHTMLGEPCGNGADLSEIAEWAGEILLSSNWGMTEHQISMLEKIGGYLQTEVQNDAARKDALEMYSKLIDSVRRKQK